MHAAWEAGCVVAGAGAFPFVLTVPGGRVPAAGVTVVGVLPTHRRRGLLRDMMRAQLDACRNRGEPIAYLWASEDSIYGRFGYGIASFAGEIEVPRDHSAFHSRSDWSFDARLVTLDDAEPVVAPIYERVAVQTPGMFVRTSAWWQARALADPDWRRQGGGDLQCVVIESRDAPVAYALFRINSVFERGIQTGVVSVVEALGGSPEATCAIWRYLLDIDWLARLRAVNLPLDHPLLLLALEPRRLRFNVRDGLWVRLVDVAAALSARSYAGDEPVVIEIADAFCPWNEGSWRVGKGVVERTADEVQLRCDVAALGSVYLGGFSWAQLARALRVEEVRAGAIARADTLFRSDRSPWCVEIF